MAHRPKSKYQQVEDQLRHAGATADRKYFTTLLLNHKISRAAAEKFYKQGENLGKFILNRDTLIIEERKKSEQINQ